MNALTVIPGTPGSAELIDMPPPVRREGELLVRARAIGICGTDVEIINGDYGEAPPGESRLVLGHESLGVVLEAPAGSGFSAGQLVVGIVRRPDPEPCDHCAIGEVDMCRNGRYTECGIKQQHGYGQELYCMAPEFAVGVDPSLGDIGVLVEPASVVAKACLHALHMLQRSGVKPKSALITGAGPIGLLSALAVTQYGLEAYVVDIVDDGPKPDLVRDLGAHYHAGPATELHISPELVIECTGVGKVVQQASNVAAPGGVIALTGISSAGSDHSLDLNMMNKNMVLSNKVLFGSVNSARTHYERAANLLCRSDRSWLQRLITRRVPAQAWKEAVERQRDDVKVALEFGC